jgi:hypothetical protein
LATVESDDSAKPVVMLSVNVLSFDVMVSPMIFFSVFALIAAA